MSMVAGSPSRRLRMLNKQQLQGEGCRLFRRACPQGQVCLGGILSARCYVSCSDDSDRCSQGFKCNSGKCVASS
ncbi:hypothetical protein RSOLAG22IIIB_13890 [Rhizoctonia solani]|uniref:Uncharacterized protein n=1 Tax=Rhizoctonia solani TaxID=456999 RepID=A0A0K6FSC8_9AGAM|nr:hypothetical protein RSOLAG22IIIB_13890 [Rhizoctonia solani]